MTTQIVHVNEEDTVLLGFLDKDGRASQAPANVIPTYSLDDPTKAAILVAADGRSVLVTPVDGAIPAGSASVDVVLTGNATMPDGTVLTPGSCTLTLTANTPVAIVLFPQAPVVKGTTQVVQKSTLNALKL